MENSKNTFLKLKDYDWKKLLFELIVVFLGVTAGFLLNNWQEERKDKTLETKYLRGFLEDTNANIEKLNDAIKSDSLWIRRTHPLLIQIRDKNISPDSANSAIGLITNISRLETQTGTYENVTNSGNLNIISDYNLKKEIIDYQEKISEVKFVDDYFYKYFGDFVVPFIFANVRVLTGKIENPAAIKTPQFANAVAGYYSLIQQRKKAYEDLLIKSLEFKKELEKILEVNSGN